jgi:hypothetical protein
LCGAELRARIAKDFRASLLPIFRIFKECGIGFLSEEEEEEEVQDKKPVNESLILAALTFLREVFCGEEADRDSVARIVAEDGSGFVDIIVGCASLPDHVSGAGDGGWNTSSQVRCKSFEIMTGILYAYRSILRKGGKDAAFESFAQRVLGRECSSALQRALDSTDDAVRVGALEVLGHDFFNNGAKSA